jgi:hypothetical protein
VSREAEKGMHERLMRAQDKVAGLDGMGKENISFMTLLEDSLRRGI